MNIDFHIPEPFMFNPLKHHLGFIKDFINNVIEGSDSDIQKLIKELKHIGSSVMDVYTGPLSITIICNEIMEFLKQKNLHLHDPFSTWAGNNLADFRILSLSDGSEWTLKLHENKERYVHIFPARSSQHSFRVKSNTIKSAVLYHILIGKDFITVDDLNKVRTLLFLSPVKDPVDTEAITEMIEIIRH
jgi:hypothetical protein